MGLPDGNRPGGADALELDRVSAAEQEHSGPEFEAQQASVRVFPAAQGWPLVAEHWNIAIGTDDRGPSFQAALPGIEPLPLMQSEPVVGVAQLRRADQGG